jgi:hypothetical protein
MKRLIFLTVGLALLTASPAEATRRHRRVERPPVSSPVPEPTAALVFGTSLLLIGVAKRRRGDR